MRSLCAVPFILLMSGSALGQNTPRTVAGNEAPGFSGDGSPAVGAQLNHPSGVGVDSAGTERITRQVELSGGGGFRATSGGNLTIEFQSHEIRLTAANSTAGLRLAGYGYGNRLRLPVWPRLAAKGSRVEYQRGSLTEWYINETRGLEQGFTFAERPEMAALGDPLVIALEVTGDLTPTLEPGGKSVLLTSNRSAILRYGGLRAWDANGLEVASRLEVNNREVRLVVEDAGAAYPLVVDPWVQQAQLFSSDGAAGFGGSVAIDGNTVVIGATGAAYVFLLSNGTWTQQAKLTVPCDGSAVAVSGNTVVAGGCQDGTGMGSVYVFQRTAGVWTQQAQLSSGVLNDSFGGVVAIDGNSIAVGALIPQGVSCGGTFGGSCAGAYVFVNSGGAWTMQANLTLGLSHFSYDPRNTLSISGDTILLGIAYQAGAGDAYSAYVYERVGSTWAQQALLLHTFRGCGLSVSVSGDTAVVHGCPNNFEIQTSVYLRTQSTWAPQATFSGVIGPVSVSGDALVSSRYVYARSAGAWTLQQSLVPVSPSKVSLSGGNLMEDTYWFIYTAPNVTVQSNTPGHPLTVSGAGCGSSGPFPTPYDFFWPGGTACTLSFTSPDTSTPGARYTFQGWEDGVATNSRTVIASATPATYVADFTAEYQLTVQASNGTVTANPTSVDGYYGPGSIVQLTAAPAFGYQFSGWSGDLSGTTNPQSVTMSGPRSVTASFPALPTYTISGLVTAPAGGPLGGVSVALTGSPFSPTVTDLSGHYLFVGVPSGGPYTVTPSLAGYTFVPQSQTFSNLSSNQAANFASSSSSVLSIAKVHTGNFTQGQNGATYTVTVSNATGAGPTSGTVTVAETVPSGMTLVSMVGTGWTCPGTAANNCTRSDALTGGTSFPAITVTVNVASNAGTPLANSVSVSGGGSASNSYSDPATILSNAGPQAVSVTPSSGSGSSGTFQFVASDTAGYADLGALEVVIAGNFSAAGACYLRYERAANRLWLVSDAGTQFTGPATPGVAATLSNSQCSLNASATTVSGSGNTLSVTVPITFTSGFAGNKNVYLWASSQNGQNSGYIQRGTWTLPVVAGVPSTVSVTPPSGSGNSGTFQFVASDAAGYTDLSAMEVLINGSVWPVGACYLRYDRGPNLLWLVNDAGAVFTGPATPGVAGTLTNGQCMLNAGASTVAGNGNTLTLTVPITFAGGFAGSKNVYLWAGSQNGQNSGYIQRGTWTVPVVAGVPSTVSVTPSSGSGSSGTFQFVASDTAGYADLAAIEVLINGSVWPVGACYLRYDRGPNLLWLVNDAGAVFTGPATPGVAGTLTNGQCTLNARASTVAVNGNTLTLTVPITFAGGFAGNRNVYLWASSQNGPNSGYTQRGTWTVLGSAGVPSTVSVTPSSGSGSSGTFQFVASDTAGYADLGALEVVMAGSFSGAGACYLRYERGANRLSLVNDGGNQFTGPATVGVAGTLTNGQCSLNAGATTVSGNGNTLTVTVPITFTNGFAGNKNVYLWASTVGGANSGYTQRGTWTVLASVGVPSTVSVTPSSGSGSSGTFQFVASDTAGYADLGALEVVMAGSFSGAGACYLRYERGANRLWLVNDGGNQFTGPATVGVPQTLSNSQCSFNTGAATTVQGLGNTLTLTVPITFTNGFAGSKNVYLWASSQNGQNSGYTQRGTWTVLGSAGVVSPVSVTPSSGSGANGTFQFVASDTAGYTDLSAVEVLIGPDFQRYGLGGECYLRYELAANQMWLYSGGLFTGPATPGVAGTLSGGLCSVNVGSTTVQGSGNTLTLTVPITFTGLVAGSMRVYVWASSRSNFHSDYVQLGTWTVPGTVSVSSISVTPSSGSGSSAALQFVVSDTLGFADLSAIEVVINGSFFSQQACYLHYDIIWRGGGNLGGLSLMNDAGTQFTGPAWAGTLSNSQCSVNVSSTTAQFSGNTLTLTVPLTFAGGFAGNKSIWLNAASGNGSNTGYNTLGTWTVQ